MTGGAFSVASNLIKPIEWIFFCSIYSRGTNSFFKLKGIGKRWLNVTKGAIRLNSTAASQENFFPAEKKPRQSEGVFTNPTESIFNQDLAEFARSFLGERIFSRFLRLDSKRNVKLGVKREGKKRREEKKIYESTARAFSLVGFRDESRAGREEMPFVFQFTFLPGPILGEFFFCFFPASTRRPKNSYVLFRSKDGRGKLETRRVRKKTWKLFAPEMDYFFIDLHGAEFQLPQSFG